MDQFLNFTEITIKYPFDLIGGFFLFSYLILLSSLISQKKIFSLNNELNFLISYIFLLLLIGNFVFFVSLIHLDYLFLRYFFTISFILIFLFNIKKIISIKLKFFSNIKFFFIKNKIFTLIILSYFLLTLLPILDADSLDYHLGFGIDVINNKRLILREDWLHHRLAGLGEYLNLFGMIMGVKNLGIFLQFSSLFIILVSLMSVANKKLSQDKDVNKIFLFLFSSPILITLVYTAKFQLLGIASIFFSLCLIFLYKKYKTLNYLLPIAICLSFSIGIKHSFLIQATLLTIFLIYLSFKNKNLIKLFTVLISIFLIFNFPHYLKNFIFYGDPISPILEFVKRLPDKDIILFADSITIAESQIQFNNFHKFLTSFLIPISVSNIFGFIGIPILLLIFFKYFRNDKSKIILLFILIYLFIFIVILKHNSIRYYYDLVLIMSLLCLVNFKHIKNKISFNILYKLNYLQCLFIIFVNLLIFFLYIPKGFDSVSYNNILKKYGYNFEEIIWIKNNTENNSIVLSENIRSNSLQYRRFIAQDVTKYFNYRYKNLEDVIKNYRIDYFILDYPLKKRFEEFYNECSIKNSIKIKDFKVKTRNPFSKFNYNYSMILFKNNCLN